MINSIGLIPVEAAKLYGDWTALLESGWGNIEKAHFGYA